MTKKETLEKWMLEVWKNENPEAIHEIMVPEEEVKLAAGLAKEEKLGPDDFVHFQAAMLGLLQKVNVSIDTTFEQGDIIIAECTLKALDRATGKTPVVMPGCVVVKITDGKIRWANNYFDFLHMFESLGLLPEDTFAQCIQGHAIKNNTKMEGNTGI